jgi:D-lyxose ketol-isomerase
MDVIKRPWANDTLPIEPGWIYKLSPGGSSSQWVEVVDVIKNVVYVVGIDNHKADFTLPRYRFDDIVSEYVMGGYTLLTEDGVYDITTEAGVDILGQ